MSGFQLIRVFAFRSMKANELQLSGHLVLVLVIASALRWSQRPATFFIRRPYRMQGVLRDGRHITVVFRYYFTYNGAWPLGTSYSRAVAARQPHWPFEAPGVSHPAGGSYVHGTVETGPFPRSSRVLDDGTLWHLAMALPSPPARM